MKEFAADIINPLKRVGEHTFTSTRLLLILNPIGPDKRSARVLITCFSRFVHISREFIRGIFAVWRATVKIEIEQTKLDGVLVLEPEVRHDERGFFFESYSARTL